MTARKRKPPTASVPTEHQEQRAVFAWAALAARKCPDLDLLFAIPNGARTSMGTAVKLKREGLRAGVPDMFLPVLRGIGIGQLELGLFVELKRTRGGRVSAEQLEWHERLRDNGYCVVVARGAEQAIDAMCDYLRITRSGADR